MLGAPAFIGITLAVVAVALLGVTLVRRFVSHDRLARHTDVAGYIYAVVGVIYGVILAQVVIAGWTEYEDARTAAANEANAILNLYRLSREWPVADHEAVRSTLLVYSEQVVNIEWPELESGEVVRALNPQAVDQLWSVYDQIGATPAGASATFSASLSQLDALDEARRTRFLLAAFGLPAMMSATLILGGLVTVGFTYLFAVEERWMHWLLTGSLAFMVALLLLLEFQLETPFQGIDAIPPTAMQVVIRELQR